MATVWSVPVSSIKEWIGPLTATAFGTDVTTFEVAFLPTLQEPTDDDWETPVPHPDNATTGVGVLVGEQTSHPLTAGQGYYISIRIDLGQSEPVIQNVGLVLGT